MMEEITIKVYEFNELSKEAQEKAIQDYLEHNTLDYEWWDCLELDCFLPEKIQELTTDKANIARSLEDKKPIKYIFKYKDLFFDFERSNYIQFKELEFSDGEALRKWLKVPKKLWNISYVHFHNERENTTEIDFERDGDSFEEYTEKQWEVLNRARDIFRDLMDKALKSLRDEYEWLCSEECARESLDNYLNKFLENGEVYC